MCLLVMFRAFSAGPYTEAVWLTRVNAFVVAKYSVKSALAHMFSHGSWGHLTGNMIALTLATYRTHISTSSNIW